MNETHGRGTGDTGNARDTSGRSDVGDTSGGGEARDREADAAGEYDALAGRRVLGEHDRPTAQRMRASGSADDGYVEGDERGEGAAAMDAEIGRRAATDGPGLRATEFDIARLPPD